MADQDLPPGTKEAIAAGCTCQPNDGEGVQNPRWPEWLTAGCPLHDANLAGEPEPRGLAAS
ncbi:hypothetical protein [Paracoccus yeei]|uniref:hypothetical protein n=1 Tax=Paracoccus yeei TaxID=147645 RepID=UPI00143197A6|nr:hypothetical protein [Paracoccus yeei]MBY0134474.1 hypothetical protein [Paracoccus yeei]